MPSIDLDQLSPASFPSAEDDSFEFKSSMATAEQMNSKLNEAASAFANTGGGCLIWGVDRKTGDPDGGIDAKKGRQDILDWVDQIVAGVTPPPKYERTTYTDPEGRGFLDTGKVIVAVSIQPSLVGPHMASDHKYYIRAGAHTLEAGHYLVEAMWSRRFVSKPILSHVIRRKPASNYALQLGIVALTDAPALEVEINISPLTRFLDTAKSRFPVKLAVINMANPFWMDIGFQGSEEKDLPVEMKLIVSYTDLNQNSYSYTNSSPLIGGLPSHYFYDEGLTKIVKVLENIARKMR